MAQRPPLAARERVARRKAESELTAGLQHAQSMARLAHVVTGPRGEFERWSDNLPLLLAVQAESVPTGPREWRWWNLR